MAEHDRGGDSLLVQVCLKCGLEYMFESQEPPDDLRCEKCGSEVFRSFYASTRSNEAADDFREATERDTLTTDPSTDIARGDLHDLGTA
ncbi:hypothetical protein BH23GEM9_BH23GEM9_36800 [soil metagenome]